jgi:hypothetical protein
MNLETVKMTAMVNAFSLFKLPALAFITPQVVEFDDNRSVIKVRLGLRTRNHLGVMYFGALAMGAELSVALRALHTIQSSGKKIDFLFKDFQADFLKRADGHVHFICDEGQKVAELVARAAASQERHNETFSGYAIVPSRSEEPVMTYKLTLSVKQRARKVV